MSVFKNLKSIFIVEEDAGGSGPDKNKKTNPAAPENSAGKPGEEMPNPSMPPDFEESETLQTGPGERDDKIINALFSALERSNLGGFDYIEFKQSVKGLEKMVTEEATRFKSAFATASTMGVTLDKLVETANYYIKILDQERSQFVQAASEQTTSLVENRKKEMQMLLKTMAEKKETIERLSKELVESENKLKTIQNGIDTASVKIENTKRNFEVSFSYLKDQILSDIDKMKNFLK
jgi:hypothetical protein